MKKRLLRITACLMAVTMTVGTFSANVDAASSTAGFSSYNANILSATITPTAGVATTLSSLLSDDAQEDEILAEAQAQIQENETPVVTSEYADVAIAQVDNYVNVRSEANTDSEVLGKLYDNSAATVLEVEGDWYKISSGSVTGYVKSEYVVVGDEELARSVSRRVATVTTETLKVRTAAGTDASVLGLVPEGDDLTVTDESIDGWIGVTMEDGDGYVSSDYVTLSTEYIYAESKAEEEARLAKEEAERKAAAAAAAAAAAKKSSSSSGSSSSSSSSSTTSYSAPSGSDGQAVVDYACQFVGNPYKYGGSSLTNGTDCSGFVMSVYAAFGVSLPHSSSSLRSVGYGVSVDEMQPGDIICYSGHVAIYVGNNTIVHASTPSTGIKYTSPADYKTILAVRRIF
jgi:cell wall-associated NlpC family hydrolase